MFFACFSHCFLFFTPRTSAVLPFFISLVITSLPDPLRGARIRSLHGAMEGGVMRPYMQMYRWKTCRSPGLLGHSKFPIGVNEAKKLKSSSFLRSRHTIGGCRFRRLAVSAGAWGAMSIAFNHFLLGSHCGDLPTEGRQIR